MKKKKKKGAPLYRSVRCRRHPLSGLLNCVFSFFFGEGSVSKPIEVSIRGLTSLINVPGTYGFVRYSTVRLVTSLAVYDAIGFCASCLCVEEMTGTSATYTLSDGKGKTKMALNRVREVI